MTGVLGRDEGIAMRRVLFPVLIALPALGGIAMLGLALIYWDVEFIRDAVQLWTLSIGILIYAGIRRLLSDWPMGIVFAYGFQAGMRSERKHARKRRASELVDPPPDDRLPANQYMDDLLDLG